MAPPSPDAISFVAFFRRWAELQGWKVPDLHLQICVWLADERAPERVLMVFRGAAKSTIYAVYKAWKLYRNRSHRSLIWSADSDTAGMLTADTINVLRLHPWCRGMLPNNPGSRRFWVNGATDARNPSMRAVGVKKNATGARADDIDFDDIEVPGNIETPEARLRLRQRISEATHIAVPGSQKTMIGTPHTTESIYPERIAAGAAVLKIPLFAYTVRYAKKVDSVTRFAFPHPIGPDGLYVMSGIHKSARMLVQGRDYQLEGAEVVFAKPPGATIDLASTCAWPERFTRSDIENRRRETRTLNAWDSQYMLEAKPLEEVRLDPARLRVYAVEPRITQANGEAVMWLGKAKIVGASCRWDPSSGKTHSDVSAVALVFQDELGRRFWHRAVRLTGELAEYADDAKTITGGQVRQLVELVARFGLRRVSVETNGIGGFAGQVLRAALKQAKLGDCAVKEITSVANKNKRILEAIEDPLSAGTLWAHAEVVAGPAKGQMQNWNAAVLNQPDDDLDALAGAITDAPERIGRVMPTGWNPPVKGRDDWRPGAGIFEVELEG